MSLKMMSLKKWLETLLSNRNMQILILIVLLGAVLRLYQLGTESIWWDEAWTIYAVSQPFASMLSIVARDVHPPLYFVILYPVVHLFGTSEAVMRLPAAIFGIMTIPLIYVVGTYFFSQREGLISAFLLSISVHHIYYSQEARMYTLVVLLSLLSVYFFYRAYKEDSVHMWVGFIVFSTLSIYTLFV